MSHELQSKQTISLGTFESTGTHLVISDPGYELDWIRNSSLGIVLADCSSGMWKAETIIKYFDASNFPCTSELRAIHTSVRDSGLLNWEQQEGGISVDAGQAGIYDLNHFRDDSLVPRDIKWTFEDSGPASPDELWYSYCCELTGSRPEGSVLPFGVVTTSGYGDGRYAYSIARDVSNKIVGVWVLFVDDLGNG